MGEDRTVIYLIRHNEPDRSVEDELLQPLTARGREQIGWITDFLRDKGITALYSSDCVRTQETISGFAAYSGLTVVLDERLREGILGCPKEENPVHTERQWNDHDYRLPQGESLRQVQERMKAGLEDILRAEAGGRVAVCTHGTAISAVLNLCDSSYGWEQARAVKRVWPWIVRLEFDGQGKFVRYKELVR